MWLNHGFTSTTVDSLTQNTVQLVDQIARFCLRACTGAAEATP